ncbi:MAG: hypothetical protein M0R34_07020 [Candidatus Marinimicrobia bacterium]|nr:hypothetical protein [Candidatus Neomarinimicrobiota bacterium]
MNKQKDIHLIFELETSSNLIIVGLKEMQNIGADNTFYHLPQQLLSSGIERLMKCYICLAYFKINQKYPNYKFLKDCGGENGHDLIALKSKIINGYFDYKSTALEADKEYILDDNELNQLLSILSEFGKYARYHNLDIITSKEKQSADIEELWENFQNDIVKKHPDLDAKFSSLEFMDEANDTLNQLIVGLIERFVRALSRQFTIGFLGEKAKQYSSIFYDFLMLQDHQIGTTDYRRKSKGICNDIKHKKSYFGKIIRILNPHYKYKKITKNDYVGEWPFYKDSIVLECREKHWCLADIGCRYYALNGPAKGRYKIPGVGEGGMAILGKTVGPFIDICLNL